MPASNTPKRKASDKGSKASSAKKPKLNGNPKKQSTPSKKTPAKLTTVKSKKTTKKDEKPCKSPVKKSASAKSKQDVKKAVTKNTKNNPSKPTIKGSKTSVTRAKLNVAVKSKAQSAAKKAKAKALKTNIKPTLQKGKKADIKKPKVVPSKQKLEKPRKKKEENKPVQKKDTEENTTKKRKAVEISDENNDTPRKRRIITPNKKYADFELSTVSPKRVSELRSFLQDKRKSTPTAPSTEKPEKKTPTKSTPIKKQTPKPKAKTEVDDLEEDIRVIKASEMKPAEKLMKKLQKKLEKEAKAASTFKQKDESEKTKITKVVTYNKPKTKISSLPIKSLAQSTKTPKSSKVPTGVVKPQLKDSKSKEKVMKVAPKANHTPEKTVKPKKVKELKREERPIQVKLAYQKNIKEKDEQKCWITGIDTFPSGEVIMVDMANKKIKLFNKTIDECLSCIKLDTIPQDISVSPVDASSAYFTKPFSKEGIQKISMSDGKLTLKESLFTNGTNRGIKCTKAGILTSVQDGRYHDLDINCFKIDLLDYEGKSLKTVSVDQTGTRLFKLPLYFTTSSNDKQVVVSDCIRNNSYIVSLDLTGKIKFKYTGLLAPRGLTVDNNDNVYVTEWEQNNVYVLSPTGKRLQVLITNQECQSDGMDGLTKPYQLCFVPNESHGQLLVSQEGSDTIKVFNISKLEKTDADKTEAQASPKKVEAENTETKNTEIESAETKSTETPSSETLSSDTQSSSTTDVQKVEETKEEVTKEETVEENATIEEVASTSSS